MHLDRLKAAQNPLPLEKPLDRVWMDVHKIIDVFHFKNHTSSRCKQLYNPAIYKSEHPFWNTQAGEQTFIWLGRFKNIVCSMPKHHHLFTYIEWYLGEINILLSVIEMVINQSYLRRINFALQMSITEISF